MIPDRPVWAELYRESSRESVLRDQELIEVTRETLRLSLSALKGVMGNRQNYAAAANEIEQVLITQ